MFDVAHVYQPLSGRSRLVITREPCSTATLSEETLRLIGTWLWYHAMGRLSLGVAQLSWSGSLRVPYTIAPCSVPNSGAPGVGYIRSALYTSYLPYNNLQTVAVTSDLEH